MENLGSYKPWPKTVRPRLQASCQVKSAGCELHIWYWALHQSLHLTLCKKANKHSVQNVKVSLKPLRHSNMLESLTYYRLNESFEMCIYMTTTMKRTIICSLQRTVWMYVRRSDSSRSPRTLLHCPLFLSFQKKLPEMKYWLDCSVNNSLWISFLEFRKPRALKHKSDVWKLHISF